MINRLLPPTTPRWRKVLRDIWGNKSRTTLVVLAIAVGVFAFGGMFITRDVLIANMNGGFTETNPSTLMLTMSSFDESLVRTVRTFPDVQQVQARTTRQVQVWNGRTWTRLTLIAVPDFEALEINSLALEQGTMRPARRQIIFERQSILQISGADVGGFATIELTDGTQRELEIVGVVHDFAAVPASRIPILTGYVSLDTLADMGLSNRYDELLIVTDPDLVTLEQLEATSDELTTLLERYGHRVRDVTIVLPGQHWASDFIDAVVLVLIILGSLALALSGLLVINMITAILGQQKRQIGMMKAVGAKSMDVVGIYLVMAGVYGLVALVIAVPVSLILARLMIATLADFLNVNVMSFDPPAWIFALEVGVAVVVPLIAAYLPVLSGTQTTVREAISDYGISGIVKQGGLDKLITGLRGFSRPALLSIRNTFRQKGRLTLTLATLAMAGAIFIAVLNTRASVLNEFDQILAMFGYDVQVVLTEPQPISRLTREASRIDGVERVEGWGVDGASILRPAGLPGTEEGTGITMFAPPFDTAFMQPSMIDGRWIQPGDDQVIVLASEVITLEPWITLGSTIRLDFGDIQRNFEVIGIVKLVGPEFGYVPFDTLTQLQGSFGYSRVAVIGTTSREVAYQEQVARAVEEHFQNVGIGVSDTATPSSFIGVITSQVDYFVGFMLFMALLLGFVGGLGLSTTMSLNVLERTREIGVMRAIGAGDGDVRVIVLSEGLLIGLISYVFSFILSFPVTVGFLIGVGNAFFKRPLGFVLTPLGFVSWLGIALILAAAASLLPANKAASTTVREALAYE